jgi:very-short-patch-repair endonuclease
MPISMPCESCGKPVTRPPSHMKGSIYCNKECKYVKRSRGLPSQKKCKNCNGDMIKTPKETWGYWETKKYCAHKCYAEYITGKPNVKASALFSKMWKEDEVFKAKMMNRPGHSIETRIKIGLTSKGRVCSEESRRKLSIACSGERHWAFGKKMKPESVEKARKAKIGKSLSEEHKKKISVLFTGRKLSPETRRKLSSITSNQWNTPESRERLLDGLAKSQQGSSLEDIVVVMLDSLEIKYTRQIPISRCIVDFYIPKINGVLHVDGEYWHQRNQKQMTRDQNMDHMLRRMGYKVLRLRESIIVKEKDLAVDMIREFVNDPDKTVEKDSGTNS